MTVSVMSWLGKSLRMLRWKFYRRLIAFCLSVGFILLGSPAHSHVIRPRQIHPTLAIQWVDKGQAAYAEQNFADAIAFWHQALDQYKTQGDTVRQAMVLTYLSLAHQHLNDWDLAQDMIQQSLALLTNLGSATTSQFDSDITANPSSFFMAQALNAKGRLQFALGQIRRAASSWQTAGDIYEAMGDQDGLIGSRVNQVEAIATLGHYRQACRLFMRTFARIEDCEISNEAELDSTLTAIVQVSEPAAQALGLRTLGNLLRVVGDVESSRWILLRGVELVQQVPELPASIQSSLLFGLAETEKVGFKQQLDLLERTFRPRQYEQQTVENVRAQSAIALDYYRQVTRLLKASTDLGLSTPERTPAIQALTQRQVWAQELQLLLDLRDWLQMQQQDVSQETAEIQSILANLFLSESQEPLDEGAGNLSPRTRPSHLSIYTQLNVAQSLTRVDPDPNIRDQRGQRDLWSRQAVALAEQAIQDAWSIGDQRAQSYGLGILGQLWESQKQWGPAYDSTQDALSLANQLSAKDLTYQWQWQLGRLHKAQQQWPEAIAHYEIAFDSLQSIRHDLVFLSSNGQFSFQDTVEPVYREFVDVLLRAGRFEPNALDASRPQNVITADPLEDVLLQKARGVMDALQVAEVENFLGQACAEQELAVIDQVVDEVDQAAALIYTIVLEDRLEVILKLPQRVDEVSLLENRLLLHSVPISQDEIDVAVAQLYALLQQKLPSRAQQAKQQSQQLYDWLINPFADVLAAQDIQTLVFVLDGPLQTIPMATLFDGDRYLVESYAIATTPGLQLVNPAPLERQSLEALLAGWITPPPNSPLRSLPGVATELKAIQQILDRTEVLTDQAFTRGALETQINRRPVPIVHLATHGQFSSNADDTFIATGDGDRLTLEQLGTLLRSRDETRPNPIQLLFLSACQTLTGDKRAALGMAGLAVRSGARSTIASLWLADDEATANLVARFYQALVTGNGSGDEHGSGTLPGANSNRSNHALSKAAALRAAQLDLLNNPRFNLPVYWAPFVLLGDWL